MANLKYSYAIEDILDTQNVHDLIESEDLECIGGLVVEGYKEDKDSRAEWERKQNDALDLAMQVCEVKNTPWPNAANVKYPLISTACMQFAARAYPALIPGPNVVKGRVIGYDLTGEKTQQAIRIGKHMSWQVLEDMDDWEEHMDKLTITLPVLGTVFKKTYFDPLKGKNKSELIYPMDLVVDYWAKSLEEAARVTHVLEMSDNDIYERIASGMYRDIGTPDSTTSLEDSNESSQRAGTEEGSDAQEIAPGQMLEQHTYIDLDGDGYAEPYIVTVHRDTETVYRIIKRFDEDTLTEMNGQVLMIDPIHYFTKFTFIPSPDGSFYDIGFGSLLGPINETINVTINQLLDAGTRANMGGGFVSKGLRLKGGNYKLGPGEWKNVPSTGDDLRKGIFPAPIQQPSAVLFSLLDIMVKSGERLSSVTDIMTGDIPGQNTKAHVALAAIDQGMKVFNAIYKRVHRSLGKEFDKLFDLNAKHLPARDYFSVLDLGVAAPIQRTDYEVGQVDVIMYSDPNVATEQQKVGKLEALQPLLAAGLINPQEYTLRYLEATEQPNPERLLPQPQGPDPELMLKMREQDRKDFEAKAKTQLEGAKQALAEKLADSKISKEEIDSIVAMMELSLSAEEAEQKVDETKANDDK